MKKEEPLWLIVPLLLVSLVLTVYFLFRIIAFGIELGIVIRAGSIPSLTVKDYLTVGDYLIFVGFAAFSVLFLGLLAKTFLRFLAERKRSKTLS